MGALTPEFIGAVDAEGVPSDDVFDRIAARVRDGRFPFPNSDGRYRVEQPVVPEGSYRAAAPRKRLRIVAEDGATMRQIGLNDVTIWRDGESLRYFVSYRGWTRFVVRMMFGFNVLGVAILGGVLLGVAHVSGPAWIGVGNAIFWGLLWPWILAAMLVRMHRPNAQRVLEEIVRTEVAAVRREGRARIAPAAQVRVATEPATAEAAPEADEEAQRSSRSRMGLQ